MSNIYDNWGKLVEAVVKREQYKKLCYCDSLSSSFSSISSDCAASTSSRRISLDLSSSDLHDGNSESFATTSSASTHLDHVPKPPNMPSGSRFDKIFGAARRFVTPVRKRPESQMANVTNHAQDINATGFQSGHKDSAPVEVEVLRPSPTIDQYALSLEELKGKTYNFGQEAMIGRGSNGLVYFAQLESVKDVAWRFAMGENHTQKSDIYSFGVVLLELLTGRKPVDITMPPGQRNLVSWATPRLSEDKVKLCVDPNLKGEYPPKAVAKMATTAALCTQYESEFRPDMRIIVKCLQSVKASARTI